MRVFMLLIIVYIPVQFLSCADGKWRSVISRPQQQVSLFGFSLKQQLCLHAWHRVVTSEQWRKIDLSLTNQKVERKKKACPPFLTLQLRMVGKYQGASASSKVCSDLTTFFILQFICKLTSFLLKQKVILLLISVSVSLILTLASLVGCWH